MMLGYIYFDNNPKRSNLDKVKFALQQYMEKVGNPPSIILVNENMKDVQMDDMDVEIRKYVLPYHMWIGNEKK